MGTQSATQAIVPASGRAASSAIYYILDADIPTGSQTVSITISGGTLSGSQITCMTLSGVDQTSPVNSTSSADAGTGTNETLSGVANSADGYSLTCGGWAAGNATFDTDPVGDGYTQHAEAEIVNGPKGTYSKTTDGTNESVTYDEINAAHSVVIATFDPGTTGQTLNSDFISSGSQLFSPTVSPGSATLSSDFIISGSNLFEPTLTEKTTHVGSITLTITVNGTTRTNYQLEADFISSGSQLFEPNVSTGVGAQTLNADFISATSQLYAPTVSGGNTVSVDFIGSGSQLFAPTLTPGAVTLSADFISSGSQLFEPNVSTPTLQQLNIDFISSGSQVFEPSLDAGDQTFGGSGYPIVVLNRKTKTQVKQKVKRVVKKLKQKEEVKEISAATIEKIVKSQLRTEEKTNNKTREQVEKLKDEIERYVRSSVKSSVEKVAPEIRIEEPKNQDNFELELSIILAVI